MNEDTDLLQKHKSLNLNQDDSFYLISLIKTLVKTNIKANQVNDLILNKSSTFINMPFIQLIIMNNQSSTFNQQHTENKLKIDQTKSDVFSFLSVFACLVVIMTCLIITAVIFYAIGYHFKTKHILDNKSISQLNTKYSRLNLETSDYEYENELSSSSTINKINLYPY